MSFQSKQNNTLSSQSIPRQQGRQLIKKGKFLTNQGVFNHTLTKKKQFHIDALSDDLNVVTAKDAIKIENDLEISHPAGEFHSNRSNFD